VNHLNPKLYWVDTPADGRLAISARPRGADWLEDEVEGWREQGVDVVVSLLTASENEELGLQDEGQFSKAKGLRFVSFPIEDRKVPSSAGELQALAAQLGSEIQQGKNIAVHCRQGIGRSSLVSAAVLLLTGEDLDQALTAIRNARGLEVPETTEQRRWLEQFAQAHESKSLARRK
jgi:protein-tyrosine phosphatase